jgi:hypothetical protein
MFSISHLLLVCICALSCHAQFPATPSDLISLNSNLDPGVNINTSKLTSVRQVPVSRLIADTFIYLPNLSAVSPTTASVRSSGTSKHAIILKMHHLPFTSLADRGNHPHKRQYLVRAGHAMSTRMVTRQQLTNTRSISPSICSTLISLSKLASLTTTWLMERSTR